jgi:hypothetical protein
VVGRLCPASHRWVLRHRVSRVHPDAAATYARSSGARGGTSPVRFHGLSALTRRPVRRSSAGTRRGHADRHLPSGRWRPWRLSPGDVGRHHDELHTTRRIAMATRSARSIPD